MFRYPHYFVKVHQVVIWIASLCQRWYSRAFWSFNANIGLGDLLVFCLFIVAACTSTFNVITITIHKGNTLTFENNANSSSLHILAVGKDGQNDTENGAPDFGGFAGHRSGVGDSWTTPPWNTVGTYHVTCTVHPRMNLTVIVTS